jgi:exodeoxyribonuclease VII large subunit
VNDPPRVLDLYRRSSPRRATAPATPASAPAPAIAGLAADALPEGCLTVSQLSTRLHDALSASGVVVVVGEVTGFKAAAQGHWYFDLKDKQSKLSVVIFHTNARRCAPPKDGDLVVVTGTPGYHAGFGKAQLLATFVEAVGAGAQAQQLEALKQKLQAAGLFAVERKRPLPLLPRVVGIVTSLQGAAVRDVLKVIRARNERISVVIANTKVQGDGAAVEIADGIRRLGASGLVDVLLVVRGGGAREDLAAFNTEPVVRAIAGCPVPVVAGVGHEVDVTLADLAADVRAATPSQAGELTVPREDELRRRIEQLHQRLQRQAEGVLARKRQQLTALERRLPAPTVLERRLAIPLQRLEARLERLSPRAQVAQRAKALEALTGRLARQEPKSALVAAEARLTALQARLEAAIVARRDAAVARLDTAVAGLDALSPLAVLRRGWALVTVPDDDGRLARATDLVPRTRLHVQLNGAEADVIVVDQDAP